MRFAKVTSALDVVIDRQEELEEKFASKKFSNKAHYKKRNALVKLSQDLELHISSVPVIGFNSQRYDIQIMKGPLVRQIMEIEVEDFCFLVKK